MYGYEFKFIFSGFIEWKPIVDVSGAKAPLLGSSNSISESNFLDVSEHDGFGSGQWKIVLEDSQVAVSNLDSVVLVQNLRHRAMISIPTWLIFIVSNKVLFFNLKFPFLIV
jgi:hypothetical protein